MRYKLKKNEADEVMDILFKTYPDARAELNFTNPFELLIATILSAQCTDVRVNLTTEDLFKIYPGPEELSRADIEDVEKIIKKCGLYKTKAKNIVGTSKILVEEYQSKVPDDLKALIKLPGVGKKTANVVVSNAFGRPAIAVDTHVFRVSNRLGLAHAKDVTKTEIQLQKIIDKDKWTRSHHTLIFHGRRTCKARNPKCEECTVKEYCLFYGRSR